MVTRVVVQRSKRQFLKHAAAGLAVSALPLGPKRAALAEPPVRNRAYSLLYKKSPNQRLMPETTAQALRAFSDARAAERPFRIQSSGHCFAGFSQTADTLIDLRKLNFVRIDPAAKTLTAGAGASVAALNQASAPHQLALPAGYCQTVALGGHVTGGGIGILSRQYGLACDHLLSARIVTADGKVREASTDQHRDLFWALKGGGAGSFGIVTDMTFQLRQTGHMAIVTMSSVLPAKRAAKWMVAWQELAATADHRMNFLLQISKRTASQVLISIRLVSSAPGEATQAVALKLATLDKLASLPVVTQGEFGTIADALWRPDLYPERSTSYGSAYLKAGSNVEDWHPIFETFLADANSALAFSVESLGGAIDRVRPADTAYVHRNSGAFILQYRTRVDPSLPLESQLKSQQLFHESLAPLATGGAYMNYPERGLENWAGKYWGDNLARLVTVKNKYDPDNLFHHPQSVPLTIPSE